MQLIIDGTSSSKLGWPKGPWMAQSAHAAISAIQVSLSSSLTQAYISPSNLASMHKVVLQTAASGKSKMTLRELSQKLTEARKAYQEAYAAKPSAQQIHEGDENEFPMHYLWVEQPENVPTCLAIAPNRKPASLKKILRSCTLVKD
ncbi:uncharacterized protein UMAG_01357 [Mycosarcoma maydis]|uniref:peptidyl-tRNA hydrolase n=1 Tax=Mycosarcoma maydis TaxID=5270 RepID=A0A0D1CYV4_MYCMD|nr:uncharacterized protein UMAG_01357 [Ustilago maydis 521]KIS71463.1 hypothetical protein UMAG_01357 [Ustilago maydis 521]|eukprot:XP_011387250.1 hypothetical protein UMAG_01357 [Ustilago maydis 521]